MQNNLLLLILFGLIVPSCGAGEETNSNDKESITRDSGGGDDAVEPLYETSPPAGTGTFFANHDQFIGVPPGVKAIGFANGHTSEKLMQAASDSGLYGGIFRRNLRMYNPRPNVPVSLSNAKNIGMRNWLTIGGTPEHLSSMAQTEDEEEARGYPLYARIPPTDTLAYAHAVINQLEHYESSEGVVPEYVEIWNEPDREEFFNGTLAQYFEIYHEVSQAIKNRWPSIKVGGMGLAGYSSKMGGNESALLQLIDYAATNNLPLDFVSWHHYTIGQELEFSKFTETLRNRLNSWNKFSTELIVSEWNIFPSTNSHGEDFDRAHSAANYASFQATARKHNLDGNIFFKLQDNAAIGGVIDDFTGKGMGTITTRGLKKPIYHLMEVMQSMAYESMVEVQAPEKEWSLNVYATRSGNRIRYVVSNDLVGGDWVWANRLREQGFSPNNLWSLYERAAKRNGRAKKPTHADMSWAGLNNAEIAAIQNLEGELMLAWHFMRKKRPVQIIFNGNIPPTLTNVHRFNTLQNNPAEKINDILPMLEQVEEIAHQASLQAAVDVFNTYGYNVTVEYVDSFDSVEDWAQQAGVSHTVMKKGLNAYQKEVASSRLNDFDLLNSMPSMQLEYRDPQNCGVTVEGSNVYFEMEANSVLIFDLIL